LNEISNLTNGNTFYYENFSLERDFKSLFNMFTRIITKPTGWEAMCKIRLSKGLKIKDHLTPILTNNLDLMIMPVVDW
jgi:protein transport protein SEC24